jgi:hypothetical protein
MSRNSLFNTTWANFVHNPSINTHKKKTFLTVVTRSKSKDTKSETSIEPISQNNIETNYGDNLDFSIPQS